MRWPRVDPVTGSLFRYPETVLEEKWQNRRWTKIEWWDDDSPTIMRCVGSWNAPDLADPIGFSVSKGVFYYEDVEGRIRRVHWYNKRVHWQPSGFTWLLSPWKPHSDAVLRYSLSWTDWRSLRGMSWVRPRETILRIYQEIKGL